MDSLWLYLALALVPCSPEICRVANKSFHVLHVFHVFMKQEFHGCQCFAEAELGTWPCDNAVSHHWVAQDSYNQPRLLNPT